MNLHPETPSPPTKAPHPANVGEEVDLRELAHAVWRYRLIVALLGLIGALAGLFFSYSSTRYVSEGLLLTPQVRIEDYKRYAMALVNEATLEDFLRSSGKSDARAAELLRKKIESPALFGAMVIPEFSFTDRDARLFGISSEQSSEMVGIRLRMSDSRKSAEPPVLLLAEYVRSLAIKIDLGSTVLHACLENQLRAQELRRQDLEDSFRLEQVQKKAQSLRSIIQNLPDGASLETLQVVSLVQGNERYLSPTTQLVGAEIEKVEIGLAKRARERDLVASKIRRDYMCEARDAINGPISARAFLASLKNIHARALEGNDLSSSAVEEVANDLDLQRLGWENKYLSQMRFVAAPEGSQVLVRDIGFVAGLALGGALGSIFGVLVAILLAWWRKNRSIIVAPDPD